MRIAVPQTAKLHPYDRNPLVRTFSFTQSVIGPASPSKVITYTVPQGRKALLMNIGLAVQNIVLSTWGYIATARALYNDLRFFEVAVSQGVRKDYASQYVQPQLILLSGSELAVATAVPVSGQVDYNLNQIVLEFDA